MSRASKDYTEHLIESLKDTEEAAAYLNAALEEPDTAGLLLALRDVAEARGISRIAAEAGLNRENVYRILSDEGNPRLSSLIALFKALGLKLAVEVVERVSTEDQWEKRALVSTTAYSKSGVRLSYPDRMVNNNLPIKKGTKDADELKLIAA